MNNEKLLKIIKENPKVLIVLGIDYQAKGVKEDIEKFIKENFNKTHEEFNKSMNLEKKINFYPVLANEFKNDFPFLFISVEEMEKMKFFKKIKREFFCMPTNIFIKNGEILPIKYGYDRNYNDFKIYLEEFKNS